MVAFGDPVVFGADPVVVVAPKDTVAPSSGSNATTTSLFGTAPVTSTTAARSLLEVAPTRAGDSFNAAYTITAASMGGFGPPNITGGFSRTAPTPTTATSVFGAAPTTTGGLFGTNPAAATTSTDGLYETTSIGPIFGRSTSAFGLIPPSAFGAAPVN
ncbi:hypothetical protein BGZ95_007019, partial [Linnemannia exigua]